MIEIQNILRDYQASPEEEDSRKSILALVMTHGIKCLYRDLYNPGHITGSALLVSADKQKVLMNHHKKLDKWICFGGHVDGEVDVLNAARREVIEESGITNIVPLSDEIFDVDIHQIPKTLKEPEHCHFDIRYIFSVTDKKYEEFEISVESKQLKWCTYQEACMLSHYEDAGMFRLLKKWVTQ